MRATVEGTAMSRQVTIELPDALLERIEAEAAAVGKTAAAVIAERVVRASERPPGYGRLRELAGCFDFGKSDVSVKYKEYLAEEALDPHEEKPDA
jgi:hypothetical protein